MKLLVPYVFVFIGVIIGIVTTKAFDNPLRLAPNILAGVVGSFAGLWIRDVFDVTLGGNLIGALLAVTLGAIITTVALNLLLDHKD